LDENIADLTGLTASLNAFHAALKQRGVALSKEQDQQFFLAFATAWRAKMREQAMRSNMISDGHALPQFRVFTVRNLDAWYDAFDVKPGQKLYLEPKDRVKIW
jgi:predicted metalloendopeptidase